jgi:hypothetical protein
MARRSSLHLFLEIEAGREVSTGASHDEDTQFVVTFYIIKSELQLVEHKTVNGIETLWPRQCQERDSAAPFQVNGLIGVAQLTPP